MTKPVTLSDRAFTALREEKKEGESDSDVVLRLIGEARTSKKDPWHWANAKRERFIGFDEHRALLSESRAAERDPWDDAGLRSGAAT